MQRSILVLGLIGCFSLLFNSACLAQNLASQHAQAIEDFRSRAVQEQYRGNTESALENYQQALRIAVSAYGDDAPYLSEIYYDMGSLCLNSSKFNSAEDYLSKAVKLNPNSVAAHLRLAELMRVRGRSSEAQKHAMLVVSKHRDDLVARHELALAYEQNEPADDNRAYKEYAALEQLVRHNKEIYEGKPVTAFSIPGFSLPSFSPPAQVQTPAVVSKPSASDAEKSAAEAKKKAEEAKKKAESDAKKKAEDAKNKAAADAKKKAEDSKNKAATDAKNKAAADAKRKAEDSKNKAAAEARKKAEAEAKKKLEQKPKAQPVKPEAVEAGESEVLTGKPANLRGKAELLTPVSGKKPQAAESSSQEAPENKAVKAAKPVKRELKALEPKTAELQTVKPKAGKHAPGLVPPPPPVIPSFPMMSSPPPAMKAQPLPQVKPQAVKKEEKPKEEKAPRAESKEGGSDEDDFLLEWGNAKDKKKKK